MIQIKPKTALAWIIALLPVCWTGCDEADLKTTPEEEGITFSTTVTRAIESDLNQPGKSFGVFAQKTYDELDYYPVFNNQQVTYQEGGWTYAPLKYWDKEADYTFVAYYPYQENTQYVDNQLTISDYDASAQVDLLATDRKTQPKGLTASLQFSFKHILTNVSIRIKKKDWEEAVTLNSFRFTGMKMAGTFRDNRTPEWEPAGNAYTGNLFELPKAIELTDENAFTALFADKLMIPQPIGWDMLFTFTYTYDAILYTKEIRLLSKGLTDAWQTGKKITYSLTITPENILFEPIEVTPWGEGEGENIVVNPQ